MQRHDAVKALDIYRRAGQQVIFPGSSVLISGESYYVSAFTFHLHVFRLRDFQSFMKYVKVLILAVETSLSRLSRLTILLQFL